MTIVVVVAIMRQEKAFSTLLVLDSLGLLSLIYTCPFVVQH